MKGQAIHTMKIQTPTINALAREWADHVGGFRQAQKVVSEAFEAGWEAALREVETCSGHGAYVVDRVSMNGLRSAISKYQ